METRDVAILAGGCFWCLEAIFNELNGVESVISGYSGGHVDNPTYRQVCSESTGHAEAVQVTYDPQVITYKEILNIFFSIHDPTTLNRQGNDIGTSYRSVIFYRDEVQKAAAIEVMQSLSQLAIWSDPIVTELTQLEKFYPAEDYHQEYFVNNVDQPYCKVVVAPKVQKFRKQFFDRLKKRR